MHLIAAIFSLFRKPAAAIVEDDEAFVPVQPEWRDRWADPYATIIRTLALKKSGSTLLTADYAQLRGHHGDWMQLLAKPAIMKLVAATDDAIYGHLSGKRVIRGDFFFSADRETVQTEKARRRQQSFARIGTDDGRRSGGGPARPSSSTTAEQEMIAHFEQLMNPVSGPRR